MHQDTHSDKPAVSPLRYWLVLLLFAAAAIFLLWEEHEAHIRGFLPYAILLACPLMHLFMHHGHGSHRHHHDNERE